RLFVDLLPEDWQGVMPGLPPEVIAELARLAEEAARQAEIEARREALLRSHYRMKLHVGEQPTFSRIVFEWNEPVRSGITREGDRVSVQFDQYAEVPLHRLRVNPPRFVRTASAHLTDDGLRVDIEVEPDTSVRGFREESSYIVDIAGPPGVVAGPNVPLTAVEDVPVSGGEQDLVVIKPPTMPADGMEAMEPRSADEPSVPVTDDGPVDAAMPRITELPLNADGTGIADPGDGGDGQPTRSGSGGDAAAIAEDDISEHADAIDEDARPTETAAEHGDDSERRETAAADAAATPAVTDDGVRVEAERVGHSLKLTFPFAEPVAAAVFQRGQVLWLAFDGAPPIDLSPVAEGFEDRIAGHQVVTSGDSQIVRLQLTDRALASAGSR